MNKKYLAGLVLLVLAGMGVKGVKKAKAQNMFLTPPKNTAFQLFEEQLPSLDWQTSLQTADFKAYLDFYHLNFEGVEHYAGTIDNAQGQKTFVHVLKNKTGPIRGTIFAHHGYFVHSAMLKYLIDRALKENYQVVVADLPGHGLSEGEKVSIQDFSDYADMVSLLTPMIQEHMPEPLFLLGHSTGGAAVWEYLLQNPTNPYKKVVLGAPLVRSYAWQWSATGFYLGQGFIKEVPRLLRPTTREPEFLAVTLKDPLQYGRTPVQWVRALIEWNDRKIQNYPPANTDMLILQGTDDTVVEASYNIPFLKQKFPDARIEWIQDCRHDMFWEIKPMRDRVLDMTFDFLKS